MRKQLLVAAALAVAFLAACDSTGPVAFDQQVVVEGYLTAGEHLGPIRLTYTGPLNSAYLPDSLGVNGATVEIQELDDLGQVTERYSFFEREDRSGTYFIPATILARPGVTYRLRVEVPGQNAPIIAETTVPEEIEVRSVNADSLVYQGPEQLEVQISGRSTPGRQRIFAFTTTALFAIEDNLTPFARALYDNGDVELEDLRTGASPMLNEANYRMVDDTTLAVQLPWIAVSFYGPNRLVVSVVDENYYDFRRTADVQQGGSTLAPGEIPNVLDHVDGGTGIFGSFARASTRLYVARPSAQPTTGHGQQSGPGYDAQH